MPPLRTVLFDYGNTLIAFGPDQQLAQAEAMTQVIEQAGFTIDQDELTRVRKDQIMRPYKNGGKENVFSEVCREIIELATPDPSGELTRRLMDARQQAFWQSVTIQPETSELLRRLSQTYRLGLLSNYPCSLSIKKSLRNLGILGYFDAVVVSADVGFAKPHHAAYDRIISKMNIIPEETVYVGDNWLADVQGAKQAGMGAIWTREHVPYETFEPGENDLQPDAEIHSLSELELCLSFWS
ncbi:HAD family hydrolase [Kiritimatiellota bacterium B12222]|nr:HAD family hydrolase [Kiritimatiellota bacterium B12222]